MGFPICSTRQICGRATQAPGRRRHKALEQLVQPAEGLTADEASLTALCDAFAEPSAREALARQLQARQWTRPLPAVHTRRWVWQRTMFLGYAKYKLAVQPVQLMLTSDAQNPLLSLNGVPRTGRVVEGGVLGGAVPGQYTCTVTASSGTAPPLRASRRCCRCSVCSSPPSSMAHWRWQITVSGCPNDETKILLTAPRVSQTAGQHRQPAYGGRGQHHHNGIHGPHGAVTTGSVVFSDVPTPPLLLAM